MCGEVREDFTGNVIFSFLILMTLKNFKDGKENKVPKYNKQIHRHKKKQVMFSCIWKESEEDVAKR